MSDMIMDPSAGKRGLKKVLLIALGIVLVIGAILVYINSTFFGFDRNNTVYVQPKPFNLTGTIYLTLSGKDGVSRGVYTYSLESPSGLTKYFSPDNTTTLSGRFDSVTSKLFMSSNATTSDKIQSLPLLQIASYSPIDGLKTLSNTPTRFKNSVTWSESLSSAVYSGKDPDGDLASTSPDSFNLYFLSIDGKEKKITRGFAPRLVPNSTSVVVLRSDGLYLIHPDGASERIWSSDGIDTTTSMQFSISADGKSIAWTNPGAGELYVMSVVSWNPFVGNVSKKITAHVYWPTFSPNGEYIAADEFPTATSSVPDRLVVFGLKDPQEKVLQDLSNFVASQIFITDWK